MCVCTGAAGLDSSRVSRWLTDGFLTATLLSLQTLASVSRVVYPLFHFFVTVLLALFAATTNWRALQTILWCGDNV